MPRIYRTKKECETFVIQEFVNHLGYRMVCGDVRELPERPDAIITLSKQGKRQCIGIEHTDYHNDIPPNCRMSEIAQLDDFWRLVQYSLVRRISHRPALIGIMAGVRFRENHIRGEKRGYYTALARELARELVGFAQELDLKVSDRFTDVRHFNSARYPSLAEYVSSIHLCQTGTDSSIRMNWSCSNVSSGRVALNIQRVVHLIKKKTEKEAKGYSWGDVQEKWLLIAATGKTVTHVAGPAPDESVWHDAALAQAAMHSPFDRILFYERVRGWYKDIRSGQPAVKLRE